MSDRNYVFEYHDAIQKGEIIAGEWIKKVYEILVSGIQSGNYIFDSKKAGKAIKFIETFCRHSKGREDIIKLELWQKAMISAIFGIVDQNGYRVFHEVVVIIGRKNGKSILAAAISNYMAFMDDEYGAEIYCLAPKLGQAKIVFENIYQMILKDEELNEEAKKRRSDIYLPRTNTTIQPLAFAAEKSDGYNPHLTINDEIANWKGPRGLRQYEVMVSGTGARRQPLTLSISTAGYENDGIYDELINRSTSFLKGNSKEKRLLPFLYMIDDLEKWNDLDELQKSNPNLGVSVSKDFLKKESIIAEKSLSKKAEFLTKYCNIKQNSSSAWLDFHVVDKAFIDIKLEDFRGSYAVGGFDLSQTTDLTAATVNIERDGVQYIFTQLFMPASRIEHLQTIDRVPYDIFVKQGVLAPSGENKVNYRDVFDWFVMLREQYEIYCLKIGYDRYSAQYLVDDLSAYGFHMDDVHQGENLAPVLRDFEGTLLDERIKFASNNLLKSHVLNVALKHNLETRKFRPVKLEQRARIDGFVSVIDAATVRDKHYNEIGEMLKNRE